MPGPTVARRKPLSGGHWVTNVMWPDLTTRRSWSVSPAWNTTPWGATACGTSSACKASAAALGTPSPTSPSTSRSGCTGRCSMGRWDRMPTSAHSSARSRSAKARTCSPACSAAMGSRAATAAAMPCWSRSRTSARSWAIAVLSHAGTRPASRMTQRWRGSSSMRTCSARWAATPKDITPCSSNTATWFMRGVSQLSDPARRKRRERSSPSRRTWRSTVAAESCSSTNVATTRPATSAPTPPITANTSATSQLCAQVTRDRRA